MGSNNRIVNDWKELGILEDICELVGWKMNFCLTDLLHARIAILSHARELVFWQLPLSPSCGVHGSEDTEDGCFTMGQFASFNVTLD